MQLSTNPKNYMTLKEKIAARLKAKAAGVNLSKERIEAIVARAEKGGLTDESDDTEIDAQLDSINELTPFTEMASLDDHKRAKAKKDADDKEKADKEAAEKAAKEGKVDLPEDAPAWMKTFIEAQAAQTKALADQIAAMSGEKVTNTRREQYAKVLEGKAPEVIAAELKKFDRMTFKDDTDFTTVLSEFTQEVANGSLGNDRPSGGVGSAPNGKEASAAEVDAAVDSIIKI